MKPNGLVPAASITSHTSIFMRSQSMASSLTSAMLTLRKMFSSSLAISATSGVRDGHQRLDGQAVDLSRPRRARRREAADHLGGGAGRVVGAPRVDALGREGEEEVDARLETGAGFEERRKLMARGAGIGRALESHELAAPQVPGQLTGALLDQGQVGLAIGVQRRRQADDAGLAVLGGCVVRRRPHETLRHEPGEVRAGHVVDVAVTGVDLRAAFGQRLDADDFDAGLGEHPGQRQTHVAHADDGDLHDAVSLVRPRVPEQCILPYRPRAGERGGLQGRIAPWPSWTNAS